MILTEQQNHVIYNDFNNGIKDLRIEHQFEHHEQQQQQEQQLMTPIIHSIKEFKLCDKCDLNENKEIIDYYEIIFNKCQYCKLKLFNDASVSEIFFIMRKWKSNIQKNMNIFIDLLLLKNCGINDRDGVNDMTLLMYACKSGASYIGDGDNAFNIVKSLLIKGADINVKSNWLQMNCIQLCSFFDSYRCLEYLLNENFCAGIDMPCEAFNNGTALHIACINKCIKSAHILLKFGANMDLLDNLGHKPFDYIINEVNSNARIKSKNPSINAKMNRNSSLTNTNQNRNQFVEINKSLTQSDNNYSDSEAIKLNVNAKVSDDAQILLNKMAISLNDCVIVSNKKIGFLRYCGPTKFANGIWAGVELVKPTGKHDGSLAGIRYFTCPKNHGIFCTLDKLKKIGHLNELKPTQIPSMKYYNSHNRIELTDNDIKLKRSQSQHTAVNTQQPMKIISVQNQNFTANSNFSQKSDVEKKDLVIKGLKEDSLSSLDGNNESKLEIGAKVMYQGHRAIVRYVGKTHFADGIWIGLEFISPNGKNDGSIQGIRYFECEKRHGIFVRPNKLILTTAYKFKSSRLQQFKTN